MKRFSLFVQTLSAVVMSAILMFSCNRREAVPSGILSKPDMVKVLAEVYIAEEKINRLSLTRDSADKVLRYMIDRLPEKTSVQDSVFRNSFDYYMDHPIEMQE